MLDFRNISEIKLTELTDQMREKFKKTSAFKKLERSSKSIRVGEMCKD